MNVHWTDNAVAHLQSIRATISRHSDRYALGMVGRIFDRAAVLSDHPRFGPVVPEFDNDSIRELFEHPYRIIYRVLPSRIDVLAVVHAAQLLRQSLIEGT